MKWTISAIIIASFWWSANAVPPPIPVLSSPKNNATNVAVQPKFSWGQVSGASKLKIQVCNNQYFSTGLFIDVTIDNGMATSYTMDKTTTPSTVLKIDSSYYWRIVALASDGTSSTCDPALNCTPFLFKVIKPTEPDYPIKDQSQISGVFGPRATTSNWFHNGMDISSQQAQTIDVKAPCNCKVAWFNDPGDGSAYADFENTESGIGPKSFRIMHVSLPASIKTIGNTFKRGELLFTQLQQYQAGGYHVHICAWDFVFSSKAGPATQSRNPLEYWPYTSSTYSQRTIGPATSANWPTDPDQGNKRYFYFTIAPQKFDYTLNKIIVQVIGANGGSITSDFLDNPKASTIDFNLGSSVDRNATGTQVIQSGSTWDVSVYNGIKIFALNFDQTQTEKVLSFWYYIKPTAPNPKYFQADYYDCKGINRGTILNYLPATPIGGVTGPVTSLSASSIANGVKLTWNAPMIGDADFYDIYRKVVNSTVSPLLVGATIGFSFEDRTDSPTNSLIPGTNYSYTVVGVNSHGVAPYGPWVNFLLPEIPPDNSPPSAPGKPSANVINEWQIDLSWAASTDIFGVAQYKVEMKVGPTGTYSTIGMVDGSTTWFSVTGLTACTKYTFRVTAFDAVGNSAVSPETVVYTPESAMPAVIWIINNMMLKKKK